MHICYCEACIPGSLSFRSFFHDWSKSSSNICSEGTKVPQEQKYQGTKVLGTFAPKERKFHRSESSKERMFHGTKVPRERRFHLRTSSFPGTKVQRNEKSVIPSISLNLDLQSVSGSRQF